MAFFAYNPNERRSNPFWDFVASMDDLNRRPPSYAPRDRAGADQAVPQQTTGEEEAQEKGKHRSPTVEDEHMTGADAHPAKGEKTRDETSGSSSSSDDEPCGRRRCRGGGRRGMRSHGPPPFGPFAFPGFFGPAADGDFSDWVPPHRRHGHHRGHHHGPHGRHHGGPPPPGPPPPGPSGAHPPPPPLGPHPGPHPHHHPGPFPGTHAPPPPPEFAHRGHHGRRPGPGGPFGRRGGPGRDFNVPAFLSQLGERLGIDLNAAASNIGLDLSRVAKAPNSDADFTPAHDLFDLTDEYLVHVSLPGAQREDIGLDFDGETHTLRVGGVVYRPGVDESILSAMVHSGRDRIGAFETKILLPSQDNDLVEVNAAAISAKLRAGILVIRVPKIHKKKEDMKRSIRIDTPSPSPEPENRGSVRLAVREKNTNDNNPLAAHNNPLAAHNEEKEKAPNSRDNGDMYYSSPAFPERSPETEKDNDETTYDSKRKGAEQDRAMNDHEDPPEQLPTYTPSPQDEEEHDDDQEGEYVKIDVK